MSDASEPAARVTDLHKVYPRVEALRGISFEVQMGEVVGLVGPNGAGKSTTIGVMLGFLRPSKGKATLFGDAPENPKSRARVGYLPETPIFAEHQHPESLLLYHAELLGIDRTERFDRIQSVLRELALQTVSRRRVGALSKGMQQRLGLAVALLGDPRLLVLDEPTSNLDPVGRRELCDIVHARRERGAAVLLASHVLPEIEATCQRVVILNYGKVVLTGALSDLCGGTSRSLESVFFEALGAAERRVS